MVPCSEWIEALKPFHSLMNASNSFFFLVVFFLVCPIESQYIYHLKLFICGHSANSLSQWFYIHLTFLDIYYWCLYYLCRSETMYWISQPSWVTFLKGGVFSGKCWKLMRWDLDWGCGILWSSCINLSGKYKKKCWNKAFGWTKSQTLSNKKHFLHAHLNFWKLIIINVQ